MTIALDLFDIAGISIGAVVAVIIVTIIIILSCTCCLWGRRKCCPGYREGTYDNITIHNPIIIIITVVVVSPVKSRSDW